MNLRKSKVITEPLDENWDIDAILQESENILKAKDAAASYSYMLRYPYIDALLHEDLILKFGSPKLNYLCAKNVKNADKKAHAKVILESKDAEANFLFGTQILDSDFDAHDRVVLESKDGLINLGSCRYTTGESFSKHEQNIIDSNDAKANAIFLHRYGYNLNEHAKVIYNSLDARWNTWTARFVKNADIEYHRDAVIKSGDVEYNCYFAELFPYNIEENARIVHNSKNPEMNYYFYNKVKGALIKYHIDAIKESGDAYWNYKVALDFNNGENDLSEIENIVLQAKNAYVSYLYLRDIKNANYDAHMEIIKKDKNNIVNYNDIKEIEEKHNKKSIQFTEQYINHDWC